MAILFVHPTPQVLPNGTPAARVSLRDTSGTLVEAVPAAAGRPVVLAFFETVCATCVAKAPTLCDVARARPDVNVVVVEAGGRDAAAAAAFARRSLAGCPVRVLLDPELTVTHGYAVGAVPAVYVIDSTGKISYGAVGPKGFDALVHGLPAARG